MTDNETPAPHGFCVPVTYNEIDGVPATKTTQTAFYVAEPITRESIERRRREREQRGEQ
ncbi:hypothetical protein ACGFK1_11725 [Mycobacterium sp. NPDC048908]|uniref:hypothetical protein n=1 Tax=Mycobacterium sp. NPDC048908 TaxID=3364292 RepID=UPI003718BA06